MRKATITATPTVGDPFTGDYGPGEGFMIDDVEITINRVRGAGATMSTSAGQDIALGVSGSAELDGGQGLITLDAIVETEE